MLRSIVALGALVILAALPARAQDAEPIFPYDYEVKDYDNGLRVVVVPTDYPDIVSLQVAVATGSRNEVGAGKTGFAHFFEHMMFRGTENYSADAYREILKNAGVDQNAYTTDDYTNYHITFSKADLEKMIELEADRFQHLQYSEADFKTEARAVLGEYNKNYANPILKLMERQRDVAFDEHTYEHTTMGFIEDIEAMPEQYEYSLQFFDRYYRPENATIIVAGDVIPRHVFGLIDQYWGDWERGDYTADIPQEPAPQGPKYEHVGWDNPTLPWVTVAFHGPAFSDERLDMATMDIISRLAFSSSSPLYKKLVIDEQKVQQLWPYFPDRKDPYLLTIAAQLKDPADAWYVRDAIQQTLADLRTELVSARRLADIKANMRYGFANRMDNSETIADVLAPVMALTRDVETLNRVYERYAEVTPAVVQQMAETYFTDERMVTVTLSHDELPSEGAGPGSVDAKAVVAEAPSDLEAVVMQNEAPVVNVRFLFGAGAASDPAGKEGLAMLTAQMIADAGSEEMTYDQIEKALFPMAAGFGAQVDKEMTVFVGRTHVDNLQAYYEVIRGQLLEPGFREEDFQRVKSDLVNDIRVALRGNNDEELGKEVLYEEVYEGHPYGHLTRGHVASIERLTLDDVRAFYRDHYTQANLTLGLAGGVSDAFVAQVERDLAALPEGPETTYDLPQPTAVSGKHVTLIDKPTRGTGISLGFPIDVNRASDDFAALWLARSYLGEHRSSNSHLYQRIREARGMNYGDYAYIEYFPNGMFQFHPDPNLGRQQQIFQIWVRPVVPGNGHFALRAALYELDQLVEEGLTEEQFEATRNYLTKFASVLTKSQGRQLGYALDGAYYGTGQHFADWIRGELEALTLEDVNRAIREHLGQDGMHIVMVTPNAEELQRALADDTPSPITYDAPKPESITQEDEVISTYPLNIPAENITVVPVDEVFENGSGV